ncbi:MAG: hypothetical protein ABIR73_09045 [Usitatibacter sp.]
MNKRFVVSVVVLFVVSMLFGFLVHGTILAPDYTNLANAGVYRTPEQAQPLMGFMMAANLVYAIGLTWIYRMGRDDRPWMGQGFRFGLAVATLTAIPTYLIYYVVTPMPSDLVAKQIVLDIMVLAVLGIVTAFINRDPAAGRA